MKFNKIIGLFVAIMVFCVSQLDARKPDNIGEAPKPDHIEWRSNCQRPTSATEMSVNNVRARLLTGGDVWSEAQYVVPKPAPGDLNVSALYAGGVWIGGVDRSRNIKLSGVMYRSMGFDFFSGPLDLRGVTELQTCQNWDRFFKVDGREVKRFILSYQQAIIEGREYNCDSIPDNIKYWPGRNNPFWREKYNFDLPDQDLGDYFDFNGDGIFNACDGDFPIILIRGCEPDVFEDASKLIADEMIFWIYNDNGGPQTLSGPTSIQMEVQVQAFAYATNDEINDMTFYRYKLLNKATEDLLDCYFAMWVDPDLGCYADDFIGCDVGRSLAYVYNEDAIDGIGATSDCAGTPTYGSDIPLVGYDYFRGPRGPKVFATDPNGGFLLDTLRDNTGRVVRDSLGNPIFTNKLVDPIPFSGQVDTIVEIGMSSFTYHENCGIGSPEPGTCDPQRGREQGFYNLIRGFWADGTPFTRGGSAYNPGSTDTIRYAFPDPPSSTGGDAWSMCSVQSPFGDRRTLQATGPLLLQPGVENELIIGVVYVPSVMHPCPDISRLLFADDISQNLFDNCFNLPEGPDAPDVTAIELDRELILMLSNERFSNNFEERFREVDIQAPNIDGNEYVFEGYRIFQLANANVTAQELSDITKARQVAQVDVRNGIKEIYNWTVEPNPIDPIFGPAIFTPQRMVVGQDRGINTTFRITEDQFATTDRRLVNHRQYHYLAIAYAYNNWQPLDIVNPPYEGQRRPYLEGRNNLGPRGDGSPYTLVPRPIVYEELQSNYGDGPTVTRISGEGNPGVFLEMEPETYELILNGQFDGKILYKEGLGPISAKVVDPLRVKSGKYRLEISGTHNGSAAVCSFERDALWRVTDLSNNQVILDNRPLAEAKEYIINNFGISITVSQADYVATTRSGRNGAIGARLEYANPNGGRWFNAVTNGGIFFRGETGNVSNRAVDYILKPNPEDQNNSLSTMGDGFFVPMLSAKRQDDFGQLFLSPVAHDLFPFTNSRNGLRYRDLNNVDIVFTSDKSKWSKCIVVETNYSGFSNIGFQSIGEVGNFRLRNSQSKDQSGNLIEGTGFSYFPGYAVDVETGKRLNIFFGENSVFSNREITFNGQTYNIAEFMDGGNGIGGDMIFNPSSETLIGIPGIVELNPDFPNIGFPVFGGQHYIYVTRQEYDGCEGLATRLRSNNIDQRSVALGAVTWTSFPMGVTSAPMRSIEGGLIPNDLTVKLRVDKPYGPSRRFTTEGTPATTRNCLTDGDRPVYEFEFKGVESRQLENQADYVGALANVNVVPNPYYAYSAYETSQFSNVVKITNLPTQATVTIYSLDGSFIRQYQRDERGAILRGTNRPTSTSQVFPDLEWDMKNFREIPVASGVYLIHIVAPEYNEERTIKWFGVSRRFDPSGL